MIPLILAAEAIPQTLSAIQAQLEPSSGTDLSKMTPQQLKAFEATLKNQLHHFGVSSSSSAALSSNQPSTPTSK